MTAFNHPEPSTLPAGTRLGRVRWTVCAMLFVATSINYMDRQVIALLKPTLEHSIGLTEDERLDMRTPVRRTHRS